VQSSSKFKLSDRKSHSDLKLLGSLARSDEDRAETLAQHATAQLADHLVVVEKWLSDW